jgi:hypothetical protein
MRRIGKMAVRILPTVTSHDGSSEGTIQSMKAVCEYAHAVIPAPGSGSISTSMIQSINAPRTNPPADKHPIRNSFPADATCLIDVWWLRFWLGILVMISDK